MEGSSFVFHVFLVFLVFLVLVHWYICHNEKLSWNAYRRVFEWKRDC